MKKIIVMFMVACLLAGGPLSGAQMAGAEGEEQLPEAADALERADAEALERAEEIPAGETASASEAEEIPAEGAAESGEPAGDADSAGPAEAELFVTPTDYLAATWTNAAPSFALSTVSGAPAGCGFAVSVDGGAWEAIEAVYVPAAEGAHSYAFALVGSGGDPLCASDPYMVWLDETAPGVTKVKLSRASGKLTVVATDALSGVSGISLDGGNTWLELSADEDGRATYRKAYAGSSVAAGLLVVTDAAGNRWTSEKAYAKKSSGSSSGKKGNGSGSRKSSKSTTSALTLSLDDGEMTELTIGGEVLDLALWLNSADGEIAAPFSAAFCVWNGAEGDEDWDTLVLTAAADGAQLPVCRWAFGGAVLKALSKSGIRYLALRVGERMAAFPTSGFIGGERYDALKAAGVSGKSFDYSVRMDANGSAPEVRISVEGADYSLTGDSAQEMYYHDLRTGSPEMMRAAFGGENLP